MEPQIAQAKMLAETGRDRILKTFKAVPDDKLTWSPAETSKSSLAIAAHCGMTNQFFSRLIRGEAVEMPASVEEVDAHMKEAIAGVKTRRQAEELITDSSAAVVAALDTVTTERLQSTVNLPFGPMPMAVIVNIPGAHMTSHAAQLDYLQTMWGDLQNHW